MEEGNFRGRAFRLYRETERNRGSNQREAAWTFFERVGNEIRRIFMLLYGCIPLLITRESGLIFRL